MKNFVVVVIALLFACIASQAEAAKKRVAVMDFEDSAIDEKAASKGIAAVITALRGDQQSQKQERVIGKNVASLLVTELAKDKTFTVVERNQLQRIFEEQNIANGSGVDQSSAVKVGKLLGVSAVILGNVTEFTVETKKHGVFGVGVKTKTARVAISARVIDPNTGEILFTADGNGEESDSNVSVGAFYGSGSGGFENSLLGKATSQALNSVVQKLKEAQASLKEPPVNGLVAYYDKTKHLVVADLGKNSGVETSSALYVKKVVKELKNSVGAVIKLITEDVAELKVSEVEEQTLNAECIKGNCDSIAEGMRVSSVK